MERGRFSLSEPYSYVIFVLQGPEPRRAKGRDIVVDTKMEQSCPRSGAIQTWGFGPSNHSGGSRQTYGEMGGD